MDDITGGRELGLVDDTTPVPDLSQEPIPVDPTTPPTDVIRALGYEPDTVQAVVVTADTVVAVSADYPPSEHDPEPVPVPILEEDPDADS